MKIVMLTVGLAAVLWFVTFYLTLGVFWIKISLSASGLALLSHVMQPDIVRRLRLSPKIILIGLVSAIVLYLIFWAGKLISIHLFSFAGQQIGSIYDKKAGTPLWVVFILLFFVTGPSEEIYWRGFLQRNLMERYGGPRGWLLAAALYAAVHIWSFNFMLIGAAAVAGLFWGAMYWRLSDLTPVIVSHAIWSSVIFTLLPVP